MEIQWPNLLQAWNFIKSHITSPDQGVYIDIKDTSGGEATYPLGNNPSATLTISNVPPDRVALLQSWLMDCWNYLDGLYEGKEHGLQPLDFVSAHVGGKPLPPDKSYIYVIKGENIFTGNIFKKNEEKYQQYLKKNLPGYADYQTALNDLEEFKTQLVNAQGNGYDVSDYLDQVNQLIEWLQKGQITPKQAEQELYNIKKTFSTLHVKTGGLQPIISKMTKTNIKLAGIQHLKPQTINVYEPKNVNPQIQNAINTALKKVVTSPQTANLTPQQLQEIIQNAVNQAVNAKTPQEAYKIILATVPSQTATTTTSNEIDNVIEEIIPAIVIGLFAVVMFMAIFRMFRSAKA